MIEDIALHERPPVMDNGRARKPPAHRRSVIRAGIEHSQVLVPDRLSVHVEAVETLRAKERDEALKAVESNSGEPA